VRTLRFIIVSLLTFHVAFAGFDVDHLVPIDPSWSPKFRRILAEKLGTTAFNCGRIVIRPPFQKPEESVSVYSAQSPKQQPTYFVTYIVAKENIWDRTDGGDSPERANGVNVQRVDAKIPEKTAELIKEVWLRMLEGVHGQFPPQGEEREVVPGDATLIEFSLQRPHGTALYGQVNVFLEAQRKNVKALMRLSDDLVAYCKAHPANRPAIASKIDDESTRLLAELK
jgi:hypothetical protein